MWLKAAVAGLVILFCTLLGYFAAAKYRARKRFFAQMSAFHEQYLAELAYERRPLPAFLRETSFSGDFARLLEEISKERRREVRFSYLTKDERESVEQYLSMLGRGDANTQSGFFKSRSGWLNEQKEASEQQARKHSELYLKLGLLAGLAIVILIV